MHIKNQTPFVNLASAGVENVVGLPKPMVLDVIQVGEGLATPVDLAVKNAKVAAWGVKAADALNANLLEKPDLILIDVRRLEEFPENGILLTDGQEVLSIPLESFLNSSALWPIEKDAEIVIYCGSCHRSTMVMTILLTNGYTNVTSLKGGFGGWVEAKYPIVEYVAPQKLFSSSKS